MAEEGHSLMSSPGVSSANQAAPSCLQKARARLAACFCTCMGHRRS